MITYRVDLNDGGDFADYMAARGWEFEGLQTSHNGRILDTLNSITCGARESLWTVRRTKRGGTTLAFKFEDDRRQFVSSFETA